MCSKKYLSINLITILFFAAGMVIISCPTLSAQDLPIRTHTTEDQIVSLSGQTNFQDAINILSKVAIKDEGRAIVDMTDSEGPINVDVQSQYWKDALKRILMERGLVYRQNPNYYQIVTSEEEQAQPTEEEEKKAKFKISTREVKINAIFFQADLTKSRQVGINWSVLQSAPGLTIRNLRTGLTFAGSQEQLEQGGQIGSIIHSSTDADGQVDVEAVLNAFENLNLGKIISKPTIKVVDGEQGYIQVGKRFAVTQQDYAGNTVSRFVNAGTILEVTPNIISDSGQTFIHLQIKAEKSSAQTGLDRPEISTQEAETNALLIDGEQTVIGGLFTHEKQNIRNGIPILKDLPWWVLGIRYLAGSNEVKTIRKELIIFIQVELVKTLKERIEAKKQQMLRDKFEKTRNRFDQEVNDLIPKAKQTVTKEKPKEQVKIEQKEKELYRDQEIVPETEQKGPEKEKKQPPPKEEKKEDVEEKKESKELKTGPDRTTTEKETEQKEEYKSDKPPAEDKDQEKDEKKEVPAEQVKKSDTEKESVAKVQEPEVAGKKPEKKKEEIQEKKPQEEEVEKKSASLAKKEKKKDKAAAEDMKQTKTVSKETKTRQESEQVELAQKESKTEKKQVAPKQKKEDKTVAKPAEVRKEKKVSKKAGSKFTVQIMETDDYEKALVEASKLTIKDIKNRIDKRKQAGKTYYSIKSGEFYDYQDAREYLDSIKSKISYDDLLIYKIK
jgi:type IV pilus assembly protein PilQ